MRRPDEAPAPPRLSPDAHKGDAGRVLCLAGSATMPGAAVLVARAAQRAGAGLVAIGCLDPSALTIVPLAAPEAVLVDLCGAFDGEGRASAGAAELLLARAPHARLVGPGLGDDARTRGLVERVLAGDTRAPLALDADALNALAGRPEDVRRHAAPCVLTPHPGEAQRLLGRPVPRDEAGRVAGACELAERAGAIVCLKGRNTVVTDGDRVYVNATGNAGMATAGAGDVLSGILVAYLAAVRPGAAWEPFDAARAAVHVHGLAGDLAARELGQRGLIASDLVRFLPRAQRAVLEGD